MFCRTALVWVLLLGCRRGSTEAPQGPVAGEPAAGAVVSPVVGPPAAREPAAGPGVSAGANGKLGPVGGAGPQGSLDKDVIRRVVRGYVEEIRGCYNRGLATDAGLKGRVVVQFTIGGTGAVYSAVVQESTLPAHGDPVAQCIVVAAGKWVFPAPEGGGNVIVTYPFVLESQDPVPSLAGLVQGQQSPGRWFAVAGHDADSLVVEVLTPGGKAPVRGVEVTLKLYEPAATRVGVTDDRGIAVFTRVGGGTGTVSIPGAADGTRATSESVLPGRGAMATILVQPVGPAKP